VTEKLVGALGAARKEKRGEEQRIAGCAT